LLRKSAYSAPVKKRLKYVRFTGLAALMALMPQSAYAECRLCAIPAGGEVGSASDQKTEKPLRIEITTNLNFSRLALLNRAGGEVSIDPVSGYRRISGALTDLGGMSLSGEGRLEGEPGRYVRVTMPERITLNAPNGSVAELVKLDTNLPAQAQLDRDGRLSFTFGGNLRVSGSSSGQFRGRIAITAEYE